MWVHEEGEGRVGSLVEEWSTRESQWLQELRKEQLQNQWHKANLCLECSLEGRV